MKSIVIKTLYHPADKEFKTDHTGVEVWVDGQLANKYGDSYHDSGLDKAEGFLDAVAYFFGTDYSSEWINIADHSINPQEPFYD